MFPRAMYIDPTGTMQLMKRERDDTEKIHFTWKARPGLQEKGVAGWAHSWLELYFDWLQS
jgi:hypothetical protein